MNNGRIQVEAEKTAALVDIDPFPQVGMVDIVTMQPRRQMHRVKPKFEAYSFNASRAHEILDELIAIDLIKAYFVTFSTPEQMRGKNYCKFHNVWTHSTASCVKLKDQIQEWTNEGRIQFEVVANATVAMVELYRDKRNRRKPTLELLASKPKEKEEPVLKKAKPTPEASTVVLCSRCKVECGIPVSYAEFEDSFKFHPKSAPVMRSPPEHFQPASPKHVRSQQEVSAKMKDSNLFARMNAMNTFRSEPVPPPAILSKLYIPPASSSFIKEEKWYIQERVRAVEITPTKKRNLQQRFGRASHTLEALDMGLVKTKQLNKTPHQL